MHQNYRNFKFLVYIFQYHPQTQSNALKCFNYKSKINYTARTELKPVLPDALTCQTLLKVTNLLPFQYSER